MIDGDQVRIYVDLTRKKDYPEKYEKSDPK